MVLAVSNILYTVERTPGVAYNVSAAVEGDCRYDNIFGKNLMDNPSCDGVKAFLRFSVVGEIAIDIDRQSYILSLSIWFVFDIVIMKSIESLFSLVVEVPCSVCHWGDNQFSSLK